MLNKTVKEKRFHVNLVQTFKKNNKAPNQSINLVFMPSENTKHQWQSFVF